MFVYTLAYVPAVFIIVFIIQTLNFACTDCASPASLPHFPLPTSHLPSPSVQFLMLHLKVLMPPSLVRLEA